MVCADGGYGRDHVRGNEKMPLLGRRCGGFGPGSERGGRRAGLSHVGSDRAVFLLHRNGGKQDQLEMPPRPQPTGSFQSDLGLSPSSLKQYFSPPPSLPPTGVQFLKHLRVTNRSQRSWTS